MKINLYKCPWTLLNEFVASYGAVKGGTNIYVEVIDENGHSGWGEASPLPTTKVGEGIWYSKSFDTVYADILKIKEEISSISDPSIDTLELIQKQFKNLVPEARCAIDLALCDLLSKRENKLAFDFFSKNKEANIDSNLCITIGDVNPETINQKTKELQQWRVLKYKISAGNIVHIPWDLLKEKRAVLDFDGTYTSFDKFKDEIIDNLPKDPNQKIIFEEPIHFSDANNKEIQKLFNYIANNKNFNILFDDSVFTIEDINNIRKVFPTSGFNIKLQKMGGFYPSLKIVKEIQQNHLIMFGCIYETSLSIAAAAQLKWAASHSVDDLDADLFMGVKEESPLATPEGRIVKGKVGLGYTFDKTILEKI